MRPGIKMVIPNPYLPLDEYCQRTGISQRLARCLILNGKLPIKPRSGPQDLINVDVAALAVQVLSECHISLDV